MKRGKRDSGSGERGRARERGIEKRWREGERERGREGERERGRERERQRGRKGERERGSEGERDFTLVSSFVSFVAHQIRRLRRRCR